MKRIICVGSRCHPQTAGPGVYQRLCGRTLPPDVEVIDGRRAGLNLLRLLDGAERVVLVDGVRGRKEPDAVVVLRGTDLVAAAEDRNRDRQLAHLLRALPYVCVLGAPDVLLVGIQGPPGEAALDSAAELALALVMAEVAELG
jgi:hydrogenase maturation protease